jgi:hypothetical protein
MSFGYVLHEKAATSQNRVLLQYVLFPKLDRYIRSFALDISDGNPDLLLDAEPNRE